jgi:hypothetical protein
MTASAVTVIYSATQALVEESTQRQAALDVAMEQLANANAQITELHAKLAAVAPAAVTDAPAAAPAPKPPAPVADALAAPAATPAAAPDPASPPGSTI